MLNFREDHIFILFILLAIVFAFIMVGGFSKPIDYSPPPTPQQLGMAVPSNASESSSAAVSTAPSSAAPSPLPSVSANNGWTCNTSDPNARGSTKMNDNYYNSTYFGCGATGQKGEDGDDNCLPFCNVSSLCSGPGSYCEGQIKWFAADADRYGCLSRLKLTNPKNNKSVVVVSIDEGPSCSVESQVQRGIIDMSGPAYQALGLQDRSDLVYVEVVPAGTPLGPVQ